MISILQLILYLALAHLVVTTLILLDNRRHFQPLPRPRANASQPANRISVCIPARNEEGNIERCVRSALTQQYPDFEVLVLDDESSDRTGIILNMLQKRYPERLKIIRGKPKPDGWLGKTWACHQLSEQASGKSIIFVDADTWFDADFLNGVENAFTTNRVDALTVWPRQQVETFWERVVIPMIYFALLTLLPVRWVHRLPSWWPAALQRQLAPLLAAANGQCIAFRREAYNQIGGHEAVKAAIVEDVALARAVRRKGLSLRMFDGKEALYCRMYDSAGEIYEGFRKNFLAGFDFHISLFLLTAIAHFIIFLLPPLLLLLWLAGYDFLPLWLVLLTTIIPIAQHMLLNRWLGWDIRYGLSHPLGVLWFQLLGLQVIADYFSHHPVHWKGRQLNVTKVK